MVDLVEGAAMLRDFVVNLCLTICAVPVAAFEGVKWFCAAMGDIWSGE